MEHEPTRVTDDELIDRALEAWEASSREGTITDLAARVIASQMHDGQASELYSFASTGRIDVEAMADEVFSSIIMGDDADKLNDRLEALGLYFLRTGDREAIEGCNDLTSW